MKKYLFLLCLFIIYLILISTNKTVPAISYQDRYSQSVIDITIDFENGINSNELNKIFDKYDKEYYVYSMNLKDNNIDISCNNISDCLNKVYNLEDNNFNINYIATGYRVGGVKLIAYKEEITSFLNENNFDYYIN